MSLCEPESMKMQQCLSSAQGRVTQQQMGSTMLEHGRATPLVITLAIPLPR